MQVGKIRYGFATNSSSLHSIVSFKDKSVIDISYSENSEVSGQRFGWENFTLVSDADKLSYLAQIVKNSIINCYHIPSDYATMITNKLLHVKTIEDGYIDHQSLFAIPYKEDEMLLRINENYLRDLKKFFLRPDIVVLGGNDNSEPHDLLQYAVKVFSGFTHNNSSKHTRAMYQKAGKFWTLFSQSSGTKVSFSFENDNTDFNNCSYPELVDIKITNCCSYNCPWCYQDSKQKGMHADKNIIYNFLAILNSSFEVFEVAFGGGDPVEHPEFLQILEKTRNIYDIVPNFSTRNYQWVFENFDRLKGIVGGVGISINSLQDYYLFRDYASAFEQKYPNDFGFARSSFGCEYYSTVRVLVQTVVGAMPENDLIMLMCEAPAILLLGWKSTGRAGSTPPYDVDLDKVLWSFVEKQSDDSFGIRGLNLSIDTCLAEKLPERFKKLIDPTYYDVEDGVRSMYIDAVKCELGYASYLPDRLPINVSMTNCSDQIYKFFNSRSKKCV